MIAVPRETISPAVRPLLMRKYLALASLHRVKTETRRLVTAENSKVQPGNFAGVDFTTGRSRPNQPTAELRARCKFESGRVRVVSVFPQVRAGDLFWVKGGRYGSRAKSELTLEVIRVRVARVQDMGVADALREGTGYMPKSLQPKHTANPRDWFACLWDDISGAGSWASNPWVWIYEYRTYAENIDLLLKARTP